MPQKWSKSVVCKTIQELHHAGEKLDSTHANRKHRNLVWAATKYLGGWRQAVKAAGIDYSTVRLTREPTKRSRSQIIAEIRKIRKDGHPLNSNAAQTKHTPLYGAAVKYFGSWENAMKVAGFSNFRRRPVFKPSTPERIITDIKERDKKGLHLGGGITSKEDRALYSAARRVFGNKPNAWKQALEVAGVDPNTISDPRTKWTPKLVLSTIRTRHENGFPISFSLCKDDNPSLVGAGRKLFGSWKLAVEKAGFDYETIRLIRYKYWSEEMVIVEIQNLVSLGTRLSLKSTQSARADLVGAAIKHFGSWDRAVEAAGFNYREHSLTWSTKAWLNRMTNTEYTSLVQNSRHRQLSTRPLTRKRKGTQQ